MVVDQHWNELFKLYQNLVNTVCIHIHSNSPLIMIWYTVPAQVQGVRVIVLNDTAVVVTWERVSLPLEEVTGYTVYYSQALKQQTGGTAVMLTLVCLMG